MAKGQNDLLCIRSWNQVKQGFLIVVTRIIKTLTGCRKNKNILSAGLKAIRHKICLEQYELLPTVLFFYDAKVLLVHQDHNSRSQESA